MTAKAQANELPPDQAQIIHDLLTSQDAIPNVGEESAGADRFGYELTIEDGERRRTFRWAETQLPEYVRPLIDNLAAQARPA